MRLRPLLLLLALGAALPGVGADLGLGASLRDDGATIHLPWRPTDHLLVEPRISYDHDVERGQNGYKHSWENLALDLGVFYATGTVKGLRIYGGPLLRGGRLRSRTTYAQGDGAPADQWQHTSTLGFGAALGFEFELVPSVTLGAEARAMHQASDTSDSYASRRSTVAGTGTDLIVRYRF